MSIRDNGIFVGTLTLAGGAMIGAGIALLFAPRSGKNSRREIALTARKAGRRMKRAARDISDGASVVVDSVENVTEDFLAKGGGGGERGGGESSWFVCRFFWGGGGRVLYDARATVRPSRYRISLRRSCLFFSPSRITRLSVRAISINRPERSAFSISRSSFTSGSVSLSSMGHLLSVRPVCAVAVFLPWYPSPFSILPPFGPCHQLPPPPPPNPPPELPPPPDPPPPLLRGVAYRAFPMLESAFPSERWKDTGWNVSKPPGEPYHRGTS